ncbi:sensor histidine kinase [Nocardioides sp. DS6]|uniref:Sensor histidine kinase n=1 Tax=Nocardioides eburneus TaxID=3231482 RepID=A0ABV3SVH3_9ACTN
MKERQPTDETRPSQSAPAPTTWPGGLDDRRRWLGPWLASIWLFFLLNPLYAGWQDRDTVRGVLGMVSTVAFAATYMLIWLRARRLRFRLIDNPPLGFAVPYLAALVALGAVMVLCVGEPGSASAVYVAVAIIMCVPLRAAIPLIAVLIVVVIAGVAFPGWGSQIGTAFGVAAASIAVLGMRSVMRRNLELFRAHEENTRLAVDNERNRFARDLHDILGHSLTVITVKAELAGRLLDSPEPVAAERARAEIADLERLSRDALADVRRAVEGYRELTLPGELARARAALQAAQIEPVLPQSTDAVPTELRELFAWTVREGVTNVIRHSGARRCEIVLTPRSAEVRDDGGCDAPPPTTIGEGSGLTGLRERAAAVGAVLTTRTLTPGFSLEVAVP